MSQPFREKHPRGKERMNKIFDNKQEFTELYRDCLLYTSDAADEL